ncbi:hypothetical protein SNE40_021149 [Patella caerulea]|uniref:Uncharacterized protein n=1 Tax=Patella caerulea TaxID=87958 RepID=A0AAN8IYV1_PATCE
MSILNPKASLEKGDLFAIVKMFHKGTKESYSFQKDIPLKTLSRKEIFDGLSKMGLAKEDLDDMANIANPGDDFDQLDVVKLVQLANSAIAVCTGVVYSDICLSTLSNRKLQRHVSPTLTGAREKLLKLGRQVRVTFKVR